jgi:hypothetical protein
MRYVNWDQKKVKQQKLINDHIIEIQNEYFDQNGKSAHVKQPSLASAIQIVGNEPNYMMNTIPSQTMEGTHFEGFIHG